MKIASFVREGRVDCGVVEPGSGYRVLDRHERLCGIAPEERIFHLLGLTPEERTQLAEELSDAPMVPADEVALLPAIPNCPLYIYNHGNNPTVWQRQTGCEWEMPRVPYMRVRSFSCFSGDGWDIYMPPGSLVAAGAELGIVIGKEARRATLDEAAGCIAGMVALNDVAAGGCHDEFYDRSSPGSEAHQNQGVHALYKAADGNGGMGPWVVTSEEFESATADRFAPAALERYAERGQAPWVYDKMMRTSINGETYDESYTNAYLMGAEWMIVYLSRFMTLPIGSVVGLGAAGWDGVVLPEIGEVDEPLDVAVELQEVGTLRARFRRPSGAEAGESPFIRAREKLGLNPVPALQERPGRALWVLRGNNPASEPRQPVTGMNPILFPSTALSEESDPIVLPPHATHVFVALHVAGIVGPGPLYALGCDGRKVRANGCLEKICLLVAVRDNSLIEAIKNPLPYESRAAYMLGCSGDGFFRLGQAVSFGAVKDLPDRTLRMSLPGVGEAAYKLADYRFAFEDALPMISRTITLLPGDVISLGSAGAELEISPGNHLASDESSMLEASASWGVEIRFAFDDRRDPEFREDKR